MVVLPLRDVDFCRLLTTKADADLEEKDDDDDAVHKRRCRRGARFMASKSKETFYSYLVASACFLGVKVEG